MRRILGLLLLSASFFATISSCKKDGSTEHYTPITDSSKPDLGAKVTSSVYGFITDENNAAVAGAIVTGGTQTVSTDQFGYFKISNASLSKTAAFIKVTRAGYFNGYRTFIAKEAKETFIRLKLIPKTNVGTINAATGGTVTTTDGSAVTLPANAVVTASNGVAYTGTIHVAAHWLNPTADDLGLTMPGNLLGIDTSGYLKVLATFGMLAVELTDDAGNLLQIATGQQATLSFPIPATLLATAPTTIPLWSFDETTGLWKQESSAKKTSSNYVGYVSHFSYWNCDVSGPLVNFTAQIVDSALHPLANVAVALTITSPYNSTRIAYTDTAGFVYGKIPANTDITMNLLSDCKTIVFTKNFTSTGNDIDLGAIAGTVTTNEFTITGTAINCNSLPITNGAIIIYANNSYKIASIQNGTFNLQMLSCGNIFPGTIVIIDSANNLQNTPQNIELVAGVNNLGSISACSINTNQYFTFSVNGGNPLTSTNLQGAAEYGNHSGNSPVDTSMHDTYIHISDSTTAVAFNTLIGGFPVTGVHIDNGQYRTIQLVDYNITYYVDSLIVTVTEYGPIGSYISGNFSTTAAYAYNPALSNQTISGSFRVKRTQ